LKALDDKGGINYQDGDFRESVDVAVKANQWYWVRQLQA
jgi:hypothetical protein